MGQDVELAAANLRDGLVEVADLTQLKMGDRIEAFTARGVAYRGLVTDIAPALGIVWIKCHGLGERLLLNREEHKICSPDLAGRLNPQHH